jgi:phosphoglucosamine mutase
MCASTDRERRLHWQGMRPGAAEQSTTAERAMGGEGRVLVRPSGTEPVIRVMVEAIDKLMVEHWTQYISGVVSQHLAV